jgi:hypothetical protein
MLFRQFLPLTLPTDIFRQYVTESSEIFTVHATITDRLAISVYYIKSVGKVLAGKKNLRSSPICKTIGVWFFLFPTKGAMERGITDDQYSDRRIMSVMLSVKMLPMSFLSYTDGINPSVKLFNGVVSITKYL